MDSYTALFLALFVVCNVVSLGAYGLDKLKAKGQARRISEFNLLLLSLLGGAEAVIGIWIIRHKSQKTSYLIRAIPLIGVSFIIWIAGIYWLGGA